MGEEIGILTEKRKEFLKTPIEERYRKYGNNKRVYDKIIRDKTKAALKDLALISCAADKQQNVEMFPFEDMEYFLRCVIRKIGQEKAGGFKGLYYEALINVVVSAINTDLYQVDGTVIKCQIIRDQITGHDLSGGLDLIDPIRRKDAEKALKLK